MAVTTQYSTEYDGRFVTGGTVLYPDQFAGEKKVATFNCTQSGAGDATSSFALAKLPPGRVALLLNECSFYCNWTTASATLDLGWDAYTAYSDGSAVAADVDGLVDGLSVDTAGFFTLTAPVSAILTAGCIKVFESRTGVVIRASSTDTAIANGDTLKGRLTFVNAD